MTGHKGQIFSLAFSTEGRFLASAGADSRVLVWDLAHGHLVAALSSHTGTVHCLSFSRDGNILVSGTRVRLNRNPFLCYIISKIDGKEIVSRLLDSLFTRIPRQYGEIVGFHEIGGGDEPGGRQRFAQSGRKDQYRVLLAAYFPY